MASGGSRPSWQTAELSEEWPMSSTSSSASPPAAAARAADASSSSSVVRQHANAAGSGRSVLSGNDDDDDKAPGTFLVRTDVPETHVLEGPLARLRAGANGGAGPSNGGGSGADYSPGSKGLFSPLRLESMFQPPSPPAPPSLASTSARADQQDGRPPPNDDERRLSLPEVTLTPPPPSVAAAVTTESTTPIRLPPSSLLATACSPPPSPSAPTPSPMPRSAAAAATTRPPQLLLVGSSNNSSNHLPKQLAHAPQVPSRLQKTFTPADLTASTIDPAADDDDDDEDADQTTAGGSRGREGGVGDAATADDDNDGDTGAVVFDQPANSLDFAGPEPSAASTLGQRGDQSAREWPATFEFECRPPAAVSSSPSESVAHDSFGSFGPLPVAHSTPADRSSASSSSSADIRSGALGAGGSTVKTTTTTPAAEGPSARKLHLFRPTYDTFTREFMSALVDTIEEGGSPSSSSSSASTADESSRRARAAATGRIFSDRDVAVDFRDAKRIRLTSAATSSNSGHNRNRTSPGGSSGGRVASGSSKTSTTASSSFGRLRRSKASAFEASAGTNGGHGGGGRRLAGSRTSRDWDGEARELMQRVRNLGRSTSPSTTAATATTTAAAATSSGWRPTGAALISVAAVGSRVLSGSSGEGRGWGQGLALSSTAGSETGYGDDGGSAKLGEGRRIGSTREVPESEVEASPSGSENQNYRLPTHARAGTDAAVPSLSAASGQTVPTTKAVGRQSGGGGVAVRRLNTDLSSAAALPAQPRPVLLTTNGDDKENAPPSTLSAGLLGGRPTASSGQPPRRTRQSPRKLLRSLSAADEVEKELGVINANDGGRRSPTRSPSKTLLSTHAPPPPAPSTGAAVEVLPRSDLSRYVSSSTGPPPSTFANSTVSSYTKHVGPPAGRSMTNGAAPTGRLTTIPFKPSSEPLRVGKLEFDRERSKWVKVGRPNHARVGNFGSSGRASEDDDPFKDFNSTMTTRSVGGTRGPSAGGNLIEQLRASSTTPPVDDTVAAVAGAASSSSSKPYARDANRSPSLPRSFERSLSIGSHAGGDGFDMDEVAASLQSFSFPSSSSAESLALSPPKQRPPPLQHHNSAPLPAVASTPLPATQHQQQRTRVASTGGLRPCLTPVSVLKKRSPGVGFRGGHEAAETPGSTVHRRSVSFSDGKKAGKIDLQVTRIEFSLAAGDGSGGARRTKTADLDLAADRSSQPSARAVRIQSMLDGLGDDEVTESMASLAEQTPSKGGSTLRHYKPRDPPRAAAVATNAVETDDETDDSTFAGNLTVRSLAAGRSFHYGGRRGNPGDATFLTECSFDGVRDRLVEIITDVHPYVAYWEELRELNLEGRLAGSVARLKEFLPKLVVVNLNQNDLSYLSGLPTSVETLHAAHNRLSELTAVAHLSNLRFLNIGFNQLEAVNQLDCLRNLTELIVDSNSIIDVSPLFGLTKLVRFSAKGNGIIALDVTKAQWPQLQSLDLSDNKLTEVRGLERLEALTSLTLDDNRLRHLQPPAPLAKLQTLKVSNNRLRRLDLRACFPQLRTLYADGNELESINPSGGATQLQTLSARSQAGGGLVVSGRELRDVKRLFLSGNALSPSLFSQPCSDLAYLELASCKLTRLPTELAAFAPTLKSLNLNYNYLTDLSAVADLRRLRKLSVVGSRLEASAPVVRLLRSLPALEMLDLRMNPFTLAMYLPLIVPGLKSSAPPVELSSPLPTTKSAGGPSSKALGPAAPAAASASTGASWAELDGAFRRALPDEWYVRRLAHRGLVMRACPRTSTIDGVVVEPGERAKADELLTTLEERRRAQ